MPLQQRLIFLNTPIITWFPHHIQGMFSVFNENQYFNLIVFQEPSGLNFHEPSIFLEPPHHMNHLESFQRQHSIVICSLTMIFLSGSGFVLGNEAVVALGDVLVHTDHLGTEFKLGKHFNNRVRTVQWTRSDNMFPGHWTLPMGSLTIVSTSSLLSSQSPESTESPELTCLQALRHHRNISQGKYISFLSTFC